eukprot:scaffold25287_cov67-Skeletonema_dohrnii-CCMP3373.AAC.1
MHMTDILASKLFCLHFVCLLISESQWHRPSIFSWTQAPAPAMTPPPPEQLSVLSGGDYSSQRSAAGVVCSNCVVILLLLIDIGLSDPRVNKRRIVILSRKFCPKQEGVVSRLLTK